MVEKHSKEVPQCSTQTLQNEHNNKLKNPKILQERVYELTCVSHVLSLSSPWEEPGPSRCDAQGPVRWLQPSAITKQISRTTSTPKTGTHGRLPGAGLGGSTRCAARRTGNGARLGPPGQPPPRRPARTSPRHGGTSPWLTREATFSSSSSSSQGSPSAWGKTGRCVHTYFFKSG